MNVYVVCFGERGEGHDPVAAFSCLADAKAYSEARYGVRVSQWLRGPEWRGVKANQVDEVWIRRLVVDHRVARRPGGTADAFETTDQIAAYDRRLDV